MFELELLNSIINNCTKLSLCTDKNHYRLNLTINKNKIFNVDINTLLHYFNNKYNVNFKLNYDNKNNRYYLQGKSAVNLLEFLYQNSIISNEHNEFTDKVNLVIDNKDLFTRSKGKKLTENEYNRLAELYLMI